MSTELNPAEMVWEDPPRAYRGRNNDISQRYMQIADLLRANPGRWIVVRTWNNDTHRTSASSLSASINHDRLPAFRGPEFKAVSRTVGDEARVYARYVGTGDES